ncbi:MAG: TspO/MBR family protein [Negativibacillus sp.]
MPAWLLRTDPCRRRIIRFSHPRQYEAVPDDCRPPFSPPAIVFPIVWTILYLLMAVSFCMVMQQCSRSHSSLQTPAWLYGTQLVCNGLWPILFFSLGYRLFSLLWLLLLLALVSRMILVFARIQKKAALLQLPYLLWLCFAAYLNLGVWMRNKTA